MPEEKKSIRLSKAAKEFNIGKDTVIEFLAKKGKQIENNPNAKLDEESYALLSAEFQSEKQKKEKADSLQISLNKKSEQKDVVANEKHDVNDDDAVSDTNVGNLIVKTNIIDHKSSKTKKTAATKDTTHKKNEITSKQEKKEEDTHKEETAVEKPKTPIINSNNSEVINITGGQKVTILGTIDLNSIDPRTKPAKKTNKEKKNDTDNTDKKKTAKKDKKNNKTNKTNQEVSTKPNKTNEKKEVTDNKNDNKTKKATQQSSVQNTSNDNNISKKQDKQKKENNFIPTEYTKLTGPKVTGETIDLSQFEEKKKDNKKKKNAENKNKRTHIKTVTSTPINKNPNIAANENNKKNSKNKRNDKNKNKNKRVEVDSTEIEKKIKETLAGMDRMGKSKTSKHRREKRQEIAEQHQMELMQQEEEKNILKVTEFVTANELATMMNVPVTKIIGACLQLGMYVSINQRLDAEALQLIADEFGYKIEFVSAEVVSTLNSEEEEDKEEDLEPRSPIVTVMGHVDHGKTSLLDYIRKTNVIAGEAGGITQHIGAYEVVLPKSGKKITFLDTPGHEAFTAMRARGAKMTDIAIIVIACDDKIMPQTIEAINHAQAANVPIVFALNKIDKPGADPERIKGELANMNLLVEDWGGKIQSQEISAKKGTNVDLLLEKVLLEAEMLDLKGNPHKRAKGAVIEASLDKGRGYVSKILVQDGTIHQGDFVLAGATYGRVKAMYNERNQLVQSAGPSTPVLLLGLNSAPQAGDTFNVVINEKEAKSLANKRLQLQREQGLRTQKHITLDEIGRRIAIGDFKQLDLIIKADVDGSVEALADSLLKLSTPEVQVNVIHKSVGQITESDVLLATASNAIIIGFQVRPSLAARKLAEQEQIDIRLYSIIYDAINELKDAVEGMLSPEIKEKVVANLEVKETFKISKVGTIAGCMCIDGKINRNTKVRVIRDGIVVYTGVLASLKRFKDEVKEVVSGQDCGLNIENFNDVKVGDIIEGYDEIEIKRTLK